MSERREPGVGAQTAEDIARREARRIDAGIAHHDPSPLLDAALAAFHEFGLRAIADDPGPPDAPAPIKDGRWYRLRGRAVRASIVNDVVRLILPPTLSAAGSLVGWTVLPDGRLQQIIRERRGTWATGETESAMTASDTVRIWSGAERDAEPVVPDAEPNRPDRAPNPVRSDPVRLVDGGRFELYGTIPVAATRTLGTWRLWRRSDPNGPGLAGWRVEPSGGLVELVRDRDGNVTALGRSSLHLRGLTSLSVCW